MTPGRGSVDGLANLLSLKPLTTPSMTVLGKQVHEEDQSGLCADKVINERCRFPGFLHGTQASTRLACPGLGPSAS